MFFYSFLALPSADGGDGRTCTMQYSRMPTTLFYEVRGVAFVSQITSLASHAVFAVVFILDKLKCISYDVKQDPKSLLSHE